MNITNLISKLFITLCALPQVILSLGSGQIGTVTDLPLNWSSPDSCVVIKVINLFEPAYPKVWGPGGALISFDKSGDYYSPFVRPFLDSTRGNVAELNFPPAHFSGIRELNCYIPPDPRINRISFYARRLSGPSLIQLKIFEMRKNGGVHFTCSVKLKDNWQLYRIPLDSFLCPEQPGLKPDFKITSTHSLQFISNFTESVFLLDDLLAEGQAEGNVSLIRPQTGQWAFTEGNPATLKYLISTAGERKIMIRATAYDNSGHSALDTIEVRVKGIKKTVLKFRGLPCGYYNVMISVIENAKTISGPAEIDHFIIAPKNPPGECSPIGVNMTAVTYSEENFASLQISGIYLGRVPEFQWPDIEPLPGQISYAYLDYLVQSARKANFHLMPITGYAPSWAAKRPEIAPPWMEILLQNSPPVDTNILPDKIAQIMKKYSGNISLWEFWNEPNLNRGAPYYFFGRSQEYITLFRKTLKKCKETAPACTLISGGIAQHKYNDLNFTSELVNDSSFSFNDYGFHAYQQPVSSWNEIAKVRSRFPKARFYMTEVGDYAEESNESSVRSWCVRLHQYTFEFLSKGVKLWVVHWFNPDMEPQKTGTKLLFSDGSPNRRMAAVCVLAAMTMGMKSIKEEPDISGFKIYRITTPQAQRLLLIGKGAITVSCKGNLTRIGMSGTRTEVALKNGKAQIALDKQDVFYFESATNTGIQLTESDSGN